LPRGRWPVKQKPTFRDRCREKSRLGLPQLGVRCIFRSVGLPAANQLPVEGHHVVTDKLCKSFGDYQALIDIDLRVDRGQIVVIIGGSGAGKTTLLKILIGLDRPTTGAVYLSGVNLSKLTAGQLNRERKRFGMVFQYSALLDSMNVFDNVAFPLREHTKLRAREIRDRVKKKLEVLNLAGIEQRMPSELSGGMKKRVGLARALMLEPEVLMYDEPTSGLDPLSSRLVDDLISETRDRFGVTSIVISHDMAGALQTADYIYVLSKGRVAIAGTPLDLIAQQSGLAHEFFNASGIDAQRLVRERCPDK
jgi:phospholipid/cholesterol/gamma-HCH transport system ATP-binding protein